jgi:hypothetical protein
MGPLHARPDPPPVRACSQCGGEGELRDGLCFACRIRTVGFTYRGAHIGRAGWNEGTVMGTKKEIYEGAREQGLEIERKY